jgi:hypothetical protein
MKTRIFLLMMLAVALFSCQKEKSDPVTEQEVTFTAIQIDPGAGLKNTNDWDWKCDETLEPVYAEIDLYLGAVYYGTYRPLVFALDGKLYTQAIKLPPGTYTVDKFLVMDDMGTPGDLTDDEIYMATPTAGADYSQYTDPDVRFDFIVEAFKKAEVEVEVLCFIPSEYTGFGFTWFHITEIIVREVCFFGDICLNGEPYLITDYAGSLYEGNGLQEDEIAYFNVVVKKNGIEVPGSPFSMAPIYGTGYPLCVQYPDILNVEEVFTFEIWVLVKTSTGFDYVYYGSLTATDNGPLFYAGTAMPANTVIDFVVGTCSPMSLIQWAWIIP